MAHGAIRNKKKELKRSSSSGIPVLLFRVHHVINVLIGNKGPALSNQLILIKPGCK